jgi:predicted small secreted protein|tara:strand:- start:168 stop:377 length:210 start_codon:yes stop_codon:yes gene_type:complete
MEKHMKNTIFAIAVLLLLSVLFTGCSTIEGIGKDIQSASKLVSDKMDEPSVELIESTEVETMQEIADEV